MYHSPKTIIDRKVKIWKGFYHKEEGFKARVILPFQARA
jgi:hypothetical protein